MQHDAFLLRQANSDDSDTIAFVARQSRGHFLPYLPDLHTPEEDAWFYKNIVFAQDQVWVAEDHGAIVGFCAFKADWLDHLYLLPSHVGKALGVELLKRRSRAAPIFKSGYFSKTSGRLAFMNVTDLSGSGKQMAPETRNRSLMPCSRGANSASPRDTSAASRRKRTLKPPKGPW